jgi:hypothetical protein
MTTTRLPGRRRMHVVLAAAIAITLGSAACGLRTPVRPPEDTAPIVPGTPTATREADVTVVRWKRAVRSADGARLEDLVAFAVERKKAGEETWERVATIDVVDQEKIRRRGSFNWRDADASAAAASYRVIAVTAEGQEGPPNDAVVGTAKAAEAGAAKTESATTDAATKNDDETEAAPPAIVPPSKSSGAATDKNGRPKSDAPPTVGR